MRLSRVMPTLLWAAALFVPFASSHAQAISGISLGDIDPSVRAQDDFYAHANGRWLKRTTFPADKAYVGPAQEMQDAIQGQLRALIQSAPTGADPEAKKLADFYASFMDEASAARLGATPLAAELAGIAAVHDRAQLGVLWAHLGQLGVDAPLGYPIGQDDRDATRYVPQLSQSGLGLPTRDYYLKLDDAKFREARTKYVAYMAQMLALAADHPSGRATAESLATARAVLALETEIARGQWTPVENRDPIKTYNKVALGELPTLAPTLDWPAFLGAAGLAGKTPDLLLRQPSYLQALDALLGSVPLATWQAYTRVRLLDAYAPFLSPAFVSASFDFHGKALSGTSQMRPRWQRGIRLVNGSLGEALGRRYVEAHFPAASKQRIEAMVANLLAAYRDSIATLDWMSPETRQQALAKLAKISVKIGYPTKWIDYGALVVRRGDLVGNVMRARRFEDARQVAKLGQPIDRAEWQMTPQTVNAYYDASMNEIVFPAAYLQAPNFNPAADDAANYGAVGSTIGHEISHGFDDEGSQYDGDGNLHDWWTADDKARYKAKTSALVQQYSAFVAVPPNYHVDGELTLGENIADNAGLVMAYKAWQRSLGGRPSPVIDGLSGEQRFFYGFAQTWRGKTRPASLLAQIKSDPHSPDEFRVIGTLRNHPAFCPAFGVKPGDKMYLAPQERVLLW
ncbi:MAG TPA: M13 family metallopeptidase [Burkholderiaceae bacterium]